MVSLVRGGPPVVLSKRGGEFVTLREVVDEVGRDAARFFFLLRGCDSQMEFDLELAKKRSLENPVFYVQYCHARICSVFRQAQESGLTLPGAKGAALQRLELPEETDGATGDGPRRLFAEPERFDAWLPSWRERLAAEGRDPAERRRDMKATNPAFIPRNHRVQEAIDAASAGNLGPLEDLLAVTNQPFDDHPELDHLTEAPEPHERVRRTFCGT